MPVITPSNLLYTPRTRSRNRRQNQAPNPDAAIQALFANGENGAWLDASDPTTMYTDAFGATQPVAGTDTVGFWFPRQYADQQGEQIADPTFDNGIGDWYAKTDGSDAGTVTWDSVNKTLVATLPADASGTKRVDARYDLPTVPGRLYTIRIAVDFALTTGDIVSYIPRRQDTDEPLAAYSTVPNGSFRNAAGDREGVLFFVAETEVTSVSFRPAFTAPNSTFHLSIVSIIPGVCAWQDAPGSKFQLIDTAGTLKLRGDAVDDFMNLVGAEQVIQSGLGYTFGLSATHRGAPANGRAIGITDPASGDYIDSRMLADGRIVHNLSIAGNVTPCRTPFNTVTADSRYTDIVTSPEAAHADNLVKPYGNGILGDVAARGGVTNFTHYLLGAWANPAGGDVIAHAPVDIERVIILSRYLPIDADVQDVEALL